MGGRRALRAAMPRALGRHDGIQGRWFRRSWESLCAEYGQPAPRSLVGLEMARVAVAYVNWQEATRALADARRVRQEGKGRRPSTREIERLSRRQGLADGSYSAALDKLRALAAEHARAGVDDFAARLREATTRRAHDDGGST